MKTKKNLFSVTTVGGTVNIPEVAVGFSSGGFSDYVCSISLSCLSLLIVLQFSRPKYQEEAVQKFLSKLPNGTYDGLYNS